jgi:hypothetical protein
MTAEHGQRTVPLKEIDPEVFALYVQLLYTGHIPSKLAVYSSREEHSLLSKLYVLTCKFQDIAGQNATLGAMYAKSQELFVKTVVALPRSEAVAIIYSGTTGPCAARRLIVDLYISMGGGVLMQQPKDELPLEFMGELALSLMECRSTMCSYMIKPKDKYHEALPKEKTAPVSVPESAQTEVEPAS